MSRVPTLSREDLQPADRHLYDDYEGARGVAPSAIHRAIANAPSLFRAYMPISNALRFETQLDGRLRELAIVQVGLATGSAYEVQAHSRFALKAGVTAEQLEAMKAFEDASVFSQTEKAVMRYALDITETGLSSPVAERSLITLLSPVEKLELTLQVGFYNTVVRILGAFDLRPDAEQAPPAQGHAISPPSSKEDLTATLRELGEDRDGPLFSRFELAPHLGDAYHHFGAGILGGCGLEPGLREMVAAVTLNLAGCETMANRHLALARMRVSDPARLDKLYQFRTTPGFSSQEQAVLNFAVQSVLRVEVSDDVFWDVEASLGERTGLVLLVAYYAGLARIAAPLGLGTEIA